MIDQTKLISISDRDDLLTVDDLLELYEKFRNEGGKPDDAKVNKRTFRFWSTKGLFTPPYRGKYNLALYPASTIFDILIIRILQVAFGLSINQVKKLFEGVGVSYHEAIDNIKSKAPLKQRELENLLSSSQPDKISKARKIIKQHLPNYAEKEEHTAFLKDLAKLYKEIDAETYYGYLNKTGDELFHITIQLIQKSEEDYPIDPIEWSRIQFIKGILSFVDDVKQQECEPEEGLDMLMRLKPGYYKISKNVFSFSRELRLSREAKTQK